MKYKKIIGIDLSLTDTGLYNLELNPNTNMGLSIKSKRRDIIRLQEIKKKMGHFIGGYSKVDLFVIEGYGFSSRKGHSLGELGGVIKVFLREQWKETPILLVPPTVLKKFITGKGNADKSIMLLEIYKKYKISFNNHNIADSFALAKFGEMYLNKQNTQKDSLLKTKVILLK